MIEGRPKDSKKIYEILKIKAKSPFAPAFVIHGPRFSFGSLHFYINGFFLNIFLQRSSKTKKHCASVPGGTTRETIFLKGSEQETISYNF
jgi:hypothetical protein